MTPSAPFLSPKTLKSPQRRKEMAGTETAETATSSMGDETLDEESYPASFQCCVCLDLLYKPVVLACGHISCFWCVHKAMHSLRASYCALCRQPYIHFPSICQVLHHLLLKMEPVAYKRRESEVLEEEKHLDIFSPQLGDPVILEDNSDVPEEAGGPPQDLKASENITIKEPTLPENGLENGKRQQVSVDDILCALCKELLFHPAVLNCGHVFCEFCLSDIANEPLKCPVCDCLHPGEFPNVCLDLDHFLEEQFPREYAMRKGRAKLKRIEHQNGESSSSILQEKKKVKPPYSKDGNLLLEEDLQNAHVGVGCDSCGMYPLIGTRYRCTDCKETIGFDLCETCYNSNSKLPGRFNQQHTPDHKFEIDDSQMLGRILFRSLSLDELPVVYLPDDLPEDNEDLDNQNNVLE